jgi:hypothetical protein
MPKLYIANATQQLQQFSYWVPEGKRAVLQEIPVGGQLLIGGRDLPKPAIDAILEHHRTYGLVTVSEALKSGGSFDGMAYSIDRPVSYDRLLDLVEKYRSVLNQRGRKLRQDAAIATNEFINQQMQQQQIPGRLDALEMSVEEVSRDQRDDSPEISDGVRVVAADREVNPPRRNSRSRPRPTAH